MFDSRRMLVDQKLFIPLTSSILLVIEIMFFDTYKSTYYNYCQEVVHTKSYSSRELIKMIQEDGWFLINVEGSHHQYKHPTKKGCVTITHPKKDVPLKTALSILKQAGLQ